MGQQCSTDIFAIHNVVFSAIQLPSKHLSCECSREEVQAARACVCSCGVRYREAVEPAANSVTLRSARQPKIKFRARGHWRRPE